MISKDSSKRPLAALAAGLLLAAAAAAQQTPPLKHLAAPTLLQVSAAWLDMALWDSTLRDGLLTVDRDDLRAFVPAGSPHQRMQIGPRVDITNYRAVPGDDEPLVPASLVIAVDGEYVVGAKGYQFELEQDSENLIVKHWNGEPGCSISAWWFEFDVDSVDYLGSEYRDYPTEAKCDP